MWKEILDGKSAVAFRDVVLYVEMYVWQSYLQSHYLYVNSLDVESYPLALH